MVRKWLKRKNLKWILIVSIVILCVYIGFELGKSWEGYRYIRVVDGDTILVQNRRNGEPQRVRLVGINAPEARDCYSTEAGAILRKNLEGRHLEYKIFGRDGFGRILAIVYADNVDVSQIMVSAGAAAAYDAKDVHDKLKPDLGYFTYLEKIEEDPRVKRVGMWSDLCLK